jgi:ferredoxin
MVRRLNVSVDHDVCVGNGSCLRVAPKVFRHNEHRQSEVIDPSGDSERAIIDAASNCPVGAIQVRVADSGEQLFP